MVAGIGPVQMAGTVNPLREAVGALRGPGITEKAGAAEPTGGAGAGSRIAGTEGTGFGQAVGDALKKVGTQEVAVEKAAEAAATGDLRSVTDYMIAATESQLTTQITVAVRDRAIAAFNDIMRMQI